MKWRDITGFIIISPARLLCLPCLFLIASFASRAGQFVDVTAEMDGFDWSCFFLIDQIEPLAKDQNDSASIFEGPALVHCVIGTNSWFMERSYGGCYSNQISQFWFTGTNLISANKILRPFTNNLGIVLRAGYQDVRISDMADGNPGRPVNVTDLLDLQEYVPWLAFCSGPVLKVKARHLYPPSDFWKETVNAPNGFTDETTVFADSLGLPVSMDLFAGSTQPVFQYRAHLSTNMLGWNFPLEFYMIQYEPNNTGGWKAASTSRGRIKSIRPGEKVEIPASVLKAGMQGPNR